MTPANQGKMNRIDVLTILGYGLGYLLGVEPGL
jgi:hypothetical protein